MSSGATEIMSSGRVIDRSIRAGPAPSIRADSRTSVGIACSAPVVTRNMYGKPSQRLTSRIEILGQPRVGEPRDVGPAEQHLVDEAEPLVEHPAPDQRGQEPGGTRTAG